ncbi:MAG: hypothetical protein ACKO27_02235 [Ilumatobacteraceae bacterium]
MDLRWRVAALTVGITGVVVACGGGGGASGLSALPEGIYIGVVSPAGSDRVTVSPGVPLVVALQVDPRLIDTNCSIEVTIVVSDDAGEFSQRRIAVVEPPIRTELVQVSLGFTVDDPAAQPTVGEEPIEVPVDVRNPGEFLGLVNAGIVAPEADDPASKLSQYEVCRTKLGLAPGAAEGLEASRSFSLLIEGGEATTTDVADTDPVTIDTSSTSSDEATTTDYSGGGWPPRTTVKGTTTTVKGPTTTTKPSTTTTTIFVPPPTTPPTTVEPPTTPPVVG